MSQPEKLTLDFESKNFMHMPSVKYHRQMKKFRSTLQRIIPDCNFSIHLIHDEFSNSLWLTDSIERAVIREVFVPNWAFSLRETYDRCCKTGYCFTSNDLEQQSLQQLYQPNIDEPAFTILRGDKQLAILASCIPTTTIRYKSSFYKRHHVDFERFCGELINASKKIIGEFMPEVSKHKLLQDDQALLNALKKVKRFEKNDIFAGELEVLYWSAHGKTSREIATITKYTPTTVATYRQRIIRKLNADNITHAVYLAKCDGLIP